MNIGDWADIYPEDGDNIASLFQRIKRQASRYKVAGRHFHLSNRTDHVFVQCVEKGQSGKLTPFLRMDVGEMRRCHDAFTSDQEKRNLRRRLLYLDEGAGITIWVEQHCDGHLYYRCTNRRRDRTPLWGDNPTDDGSDLRKAEVVCCPFDLKSSQSEFARIKGLILTRRANRINGKT